MSNELGLEEMLLNDPVLFRCEDGISEITKNSQADAEGKEVFQ